MPKGSKPLEPKEIQRRYETHGFYLLENIEGKYISSKHKLKCIDKEGYLYSINYNNLGGKKSPYRFSKFNPYTIQNIQHFLDIESPQCKILSEEYINDKEPLKFSCSKCGKTFERNFEYVHSHHRFLCHECISDNINGLKYSFEEVEEIFNKNGYTLLQNNYEGNNNLMLCKNSEGYIVHVRLTQINTEDKKDPYIFSTKFNGDNYIYNINLLLKKMSSGSKALYFTLDKEIYGGDPCIHCVCECGNEFITNIDGIRNGQTRCTSCTHYYSRMEEKVRIWLENKHIEYVRQKKFDDCKDIRCLPFDYYLPKYNMCIEVDGSQHMEERRWSTQQSNEEIEQRLKKTQYHDKLKEEYCANNGIELLRIPESIIRRSEEYKVVLYNKLIKD